MSSVSGDTADRIGYLLEASTNLGTSMTKHVHGSMDIKVQEKTFERFITVVTKTTIASILVLVFMALVNS